MFLLGLDLNCEVGFRFSARHLSAGERNESGQAGACVVDRAFVRVTDPDPNALASARQLHLFI